jgi:hypothetical protein
MEERAMHRVQPTLILFLTIILLGLPGISGAQNEDKVAVLITSWCSPRGFDFDYAWRSHSQCRVGDRTEYEGQPCKIGHVGEFPYQTHLGLIPWFLAWETPGFELIFDNSGIYQLAGDTYVHIHPDGDSIPVGSIPAGIPITPVVELEDAMNGGLLYPPDPRDGTDHLDGWYKIGSSDFPFPNGWGDLYERGPLGNMRYRYIINVMDNPPSESDTVLEIEEYTWQMLEHAFGNNIDVRKGCYDWVEGYTRWEGEVAKEFANEGFRKMLLARETTDNNNYANEYMTGNYVKESLCEAGVLDEMEIYHTRQVGRTPEFHAMNIRNIRRFIEAYPAGSTIALIYVTRGLPWAIDEISHHTGTQHPWSREVYHENAYLNYLSWKAAIKKEFGNRFNLIFTKGGVESDLRKDNFYTYGTERAQMLGGEFTTLRETIQVVKQDGHDKIIIAPCHWFYDGYDTLYVNRVVNNLPLQTNEELAQEVYHKTHCEDLDGNWVDCASEGVVAEIVHAESFSHFTDDFATAYYVVLQGTLERFGLYPNGEEPVIEASQLVTKLEGGTVDVTEPTSQIKGAKIEIPADPYPSRPEGFTQETCIPINDPNDTNDCMWEDTEIIIGHRTTPPPMSSSSPLGPAVHFGPYRNFFNREVTITVPYTSDKAGGQTVKVYVYNHLTDDWDSINPEAVDKNTELVTFKTKVLGLFQAGVDLCPVEMMYGNSSEEVRLLRSFRDKVLNKTKEGQELVRLYYQLGSILVKEIKKDEGSAKEIKKIVDGVLPLIRKVVK